MAVIYFGVARKHFALGAALIAAASVVLGWTAPRRWGVGIALHYLSRVRFPDPDDPIPDHPPSA